jgi:low affinity Fe/Cu permease
MALNGDKEKSLLERVGCRVSEWVADVSAHPFAQVGFIVICVAWFLIGWNVNLLTAGLSIMAITLTQMVLNRQNEREIEDRRRDVAMHAKLDELIAATRSAKNEFVGIEEKEEEEIVQLKEEVKEAIEESPEGSNPVVRETAKKAVEQATEEIKQEGRKRNGRKASSNGAGKKRAASGRR